MFRELWGKLTNSGQIPEEKQMELEKIIADAREQAKKDFYQSLDVASLFEEIEPETGWAQYIPWILCAVFGLIAIFK